MGESWLCHKLLILANAGPHLVSSTSLSRKPDSRLAVSGLEATRGRGLATVSTHSIVTMKVLRESLWQRQGRSKEEGAALSLLLGYTGSSVSVSPSVKPGDLTPSHRAGRPRGRHLPCGHRCAVSPGTRGQGGRPRRTSRNPLPRRWGSPRG